jgi:hypothetical protein
LPHIFIRQQDLAVRLHPVHQLIRQLAAVGHHVHAVGADLLGIGRKLGDAVIGGAENIARAVIVGHGVAELAELVHRLLLGELAGVLLFLQLERHVLGHLGDRLGLVDAGVQHFLLNQIAGQAAGHA